MPLSLMIGALTLLSGCKTTQSSTVKYVSAPTTLETIASTTCVDYKKTDACLLRLAGYKATPEILKDMDQYASEFSDEAKPLSTGDYPITLQEVIAIRKYTGIDFHEMNQALRGGAKMEWNMFEKVIYAAASGLNSLTPLVSKDLAYRWEATGKEKIEKLTGVYTVGNIIFEPTFLSASANKDLNFELPNEEEILLKYTIKSKTGVLIEAFSNRDEKEVLFTPGSVFRVIAFETSTTTSMPIAIDPFANKLKYKPGVPVPMLLIGLEEVDEAEVKAAAPKSAL